MKIITLLENRTISKEYKHKHGLSLYIETANHKILFDTGTDESFAHNASILGVNLEDIDIAVVSHGHYDHGGGLEEFLKINNKAKIYIGKGAFDRHLIKLLGFIKYDIGLKKELINSNRFVFVDKIMRIDDELILFSNVKGEEFIPKGNDKLLKKYNDGSVKKDDFEHEISLLINENNNYSLFCGCAHKGIINIIDKAKAITNSNLNTVIGGFHLMGLKVKNLDDKSFLDNLSNTLNSSNVNKYYTCHCTGEEVYNYLRENINNLDELKTGIIIHI